MKEQGAMLRNKWWGATSRNKWWRANDIPTSRIPMQRVLPMTNKPQVTPFILLLFENALRPWSCTLASKASRGLLASKRLCPPLLIICFYYQSVEPHYHHTDKLFKTSHRPNLCILASRAARALLASKQLCCPSPIKSSYNFTSSAPGRHQL